MIKSDTGVGMI